MYLEKIRNKPFNRLVNAMQRIDVFIFRPTGLSGSTKAHDTQFCGVAVAAGLKSVRGFMAAMLEGLEK